jgi:hypothetical protein
LSSVTSGDRARGHRPQADVPLDPTLNPIFQVRSPSSNASSSICVALHSDVRVMVSIVALLSSLHLEEA